VEMEDDTNEYFYEEGNSLWSLSDDGVVCHVLDQELISYHYSSCWLLLLLLLFIFLEGKGKGRYSPLWEPHLRAMGRHLPYEITQCYYLPPDTSECAPPNLTHAGW